MAPGNSYRWVTWVGLALTCACGLAALSSGLGYRAGLWPYAVGFCILGWSAGLAVVTAPVCLIALFLSIGKSTRALLLCAVGVTVSLVIALVPMQWKLALDRLPKIHDITTDTDDPPVFVAAGRLRTTTDHGLAYQGASLATKQKAAYPDVRPLFTQTGKRQVYEASLVVIRSMGLELVASSPGEGPMGDATLEAVSTSVLFGFKDDMVVRIRDLGGGCRVDARSMSRVGVSDLGENARRILRFLERLREKLR